MGGEGRERGEERRGERRGEGGERRGVGGEEREEEREEREEKGEGGKGKRRGREEGKVGNVGIFFIPQLISELRNKLDLETLFIPPPAACSTPRGTQKIVNKLVE